MEAKGGFSMLEMSGITYDVKLKKEKKRLLEIEHMQLQRGERLGIVGPNGAGKSTALKLMALLDKPSGGTIHFLGKQVFPGNFPLALRRRMATVFQRPLLMDTTVQHNIAVGLKFRRYDQQTIQERVQEWMGQFNIVHLAHQHAYTLSGGEAQRVSLARALVIEPDLLLLDEPFSALDFPTKVSIMEDLLSILQKKQTATVFVSHDLLEVKYMTDSLMVLLDGEVAQQDSTEHIITSPDQKVAPFIRQWSKFMTNSRVDMFERS